MRIAIIGAGIAGLSCARLLDDAHDVTVYEARARAGGHSDTVEVAVPEFGALFNQLRNEGRDVVQDQVNLVRGGQQESLLVRIRKPSSRPSATAHNMAPTAAVVLGSSTRPAESRKGYQLPAR